MLRLTPRVRKRLRHGLRHVYWIGGAPCAGKSTIARRISESHGFHLYSTDTAMADHARRSTPESCPLLHKFMSMRMDERWVNRSPRTMLETFPWFQGEAFDMIVEDLLQLPEETRVIVEGFRLLPDLVKPLHPAPDHAVWLFPTPQFRKATMEKRRWPADGFLSKTSDPGKALQNLLKRDRMFTSLLRSKVRQSALPLIDVRTTTTEQGLLAQIAKIFTPA